jgi:hypothetical protein
MAKYGIDAISRFSDARANNVSISADLVYTGDRSNAFDSGLSAAGHTRVFYRAEHDCCEKDLRDSDAGGADIEGADEVDVFWIETHGNHKSDGQARLLFDVPRDDWRTFSGCWQLGENWNAEWVMAYACQTAAEPLALWNIFAGLHLFCGAYDDMFDGFGTDEYGADVAANLVDGHTVCEAWLDGVFDGWVPNHPVVVGPADAQTWNGGDVNWASSPHEIDHFWTHGPVSRDLAPAEQACLLRRWIEGGAVVSA